MPQADRAIGPEPRAPFGGGRPPAAPLGGDETAVALPALSRPHRWTLSVILLLGLFLRLRGAGDESLWEDEVASLCYAERSPAELLTEPVDPGNPPGYYILLRGWVAAFGTGEFALRLSSILVGVGTILVLFLLARRLTGSDPTALTAALLLAATGGHVFMSQEVRSYALVTLLATASTLALLRCFERGSRGRWLAYVLLAFPMGWLHYQGGLVLLGQGLGGLWWFLAGRERRTGLPRFLMAQGAVLLLLLPVLLVHLRPSLAESGVYHFWQPMADWRDPWLVLMRGTLSFGVAPSAPLAALALGLLAVALPAGLLLLFRSRRLDLYRGPFLAILYAGPAVYVAASFSAPIWHDRYLLAFQPFLMIAIACGIGRLLGRCRPFGGAVALLVAAAFLPGTLYLKAHSPRPDYQAAAARLLERNPEGRDDVFVLRYAWKAIEHYYPHRVSGLDDPEQLIESVRASAAVDRPVHVVLSGMQSGPAERAWVEKELESHLTLRESFEANRVSVLTFTR